MSIRTLASVACALAAGLTGQSASADSIKVNAASFVRAESDTYMKNMAAQAGGLGVFFHYRTPTPLDKQIVIRMNLDTLYSSAVFDLAAGPVAVLVTVSTQMSRPSKLLPIDSIATSCGCSRASACSKAVSSG